MNRIFDDLEEYTVPQPPAATFSPGSFIFCPTALTQGISFTQHLYQQSLYQWAYEQAKASARPSLPERDLLGVWN